MNSGPILTNCARISYKYLVDPNGNYVTDCAFAKNSIQVTPKIKICYSKCNEDNECGEQQKSYIEAYNLSEYPIEIKLRVFLPPYADYNPTSFIINGSKVCCICLSNCIDMGVIMPCASSHASYCLYIKPNNNGSKQLSRVEIFYRIGLPGSVCNKWYYKKEEVFII